MSDTSVSCRSCPRSLPLLQVFLPAPVSCPLPPPSAFHSAPLALRASLSLYSPSRGLLSLLSLSVPQSLSEHRCHCLPVPVGSVPPTLLLLVFTLIFSPLPSPGCLSWPAPLTPSRSLRPWETQQGCPGQTFPGGPWKPSLRGCCLAPTQRDRRGTGRLWPVWPEGSVCAVAWSSPPPGPAGLLPPPDWGRVNTAEGSLGYLYRGPGVGPVPTTAPALPCLPQPALSQRGTSQHGDMPQAQPPLSTEAPGASLGRRMPACSGNTTETQSHRRRCCEQEYTPTPPRTPDAPEGGAE